MSNLAMANKRVSNISDEEEQLEELRRGPWTIEEDTLLSNYINFHGEGRWNLLAKSSGLKRTGKSCRLRWLNYLKPDIKRGNLTPKEQILILELHSKWGNRWSKIAQHLPGRTDNEIKNYWRTRVQKQARQLKVDSNSKKFLEALRRFWMPRLREKIEQNSPSSSSSSFSSTSTQDSLTLSPLAKQAPMPLSSPQQPSKLVNNNFNPSSSICSSDSMRIPKLFENSEQPNSTAYYNSSPSNDCYYVDISSFDVEGFSQVDMSAVGSNKISISDCQMAEIDWTNGDAAGNFWDLDELWEMRN